MPDQTELSCVSCDTTFDPAPSGGFCPDCDTPHPDYEAPAADDAETDESASAPEITDGGGNVITDSDDVTVQSDADAAVETDDDDTPDAEADDEEAVDSDADEGDDADETPSGDDADEPATIECGSCGSTVDASASFCPDCGDELEEPEDDADDEPAELSACPDCGESIDDESYCPNCGTDLDAIRESGGVEEATEDAAADEPDADADDGDEDEAAPDEPDDAADSADDADAEDDGTDETDDTPEEVTLVIDGEPYTFEDGDVFGRRDEAWLSDLVAASGGREDVRYLSSEHLEFAVEDDGVYVTDVSTNGTKLNGTPMDGSEERLEDGDTLELADRAEIDVKL